MHLPTTIVPSDSPSIFDPSTCVRKGFCPIFTKDALKTNSTDISHSLYFEQHGSGTTYKIIFIMGLGANCSQWINQVAYFSKVPGFSVLVFDNRGVGNSGYPRGPYSTSAMAEDTIQLLDYVGWTEEREVHVVGLSVGGMIAQELVSRIPDRIASLLLAVTKSGTGGWPWSNLSPRTGLSNSLNAMMATPEERTHLAMSTLFTPSWLESRDENDPQGRTNEEVQIKEYLSRFSNTKPQLLYGQLSQMAAALTHYVSPSRLTLIASAIPKVTILTGDTDHMIPAEHSKFLKSCMPKAELVWWANTGHGVHLQRPKELNDLIERTVKEGSENSKLFQWHRQAAVAAIAAGKYESNTLLF